MSFGDLVKDLRIAQKKTLRQFCLDHGHDPSNWSKLERGINPPPKDEKTLEKWAKQLELKTGTPEWQHFMDQADISRGEIPKHVLTDEELLKKLPVFFRSIRGAELTSEQLDDLIKKIREVHSPGERKRKL
jgi:transcriptional regulator with XRE-family HTH domain